MNKVILIGNVASDIENRVSQSGVPMTTFRLATQRKYASAQTGQKETDFHNVVCFHKLAETCSKYLAKGQKCAVEGAIIYRSYTARDGSKRYVTDIIADSVEFLSYASGTQRGEQQAGGQAQAGSGTDMNGFTRVNIPDDDIPF